MRRLLEFMSMQNPALFVVQDRPSGLIADLLKRLERAALDIELFLSRRRNLLLLLCTLSYAYVTCHRASRKLFWFDELFTVHISGLPSPRLIWNALIGGADYNPPLLYMLTWLSQALLGTGHVATRLPAIVGFWVFCLCLFRFVAIRSTVLAGFISLAFPLITPAYWYAYEARSHGAVLGFCGLALISWQAAASKTRRRWGPTLVLFASLACALATHSYAFLLFVPFVAGELVRSIVERRIDWAVWAALCVSGLAVMISVPLLLSYRSHFGAGDLLPASTITLLRTYEWLLAPATGLFVALMTLICAVHGVRRESGALQPQPGIAAHGSETYGFEWSESAVLVAFLTIPFFSFLSARLLGAPMVGRYSLAVVAGLACLIGMIASKRTLIGLVILFLLSIQVAGEFWSFVRETTIIEPSSQYTLSTSIDAFTERYRRISSVDEKLPIVLLDALDAPTFFYYAPPDIAPRFVYLKNEGTQFDLESIYQPLVPCCKASFPTSTLGQILASSNSFLAYSTAQALRRINELTQSGATVSVKLLADGYGLFLVTYPSNSPRHDSDTVKNDQQSTVTR